MRDVIWRITPGIVLQYAVDSRSVCSVLALTGSPAEDVKGITESIERGVHPWSLDALISAVDRAKGPRQTYEAVLRPDLEAAARNDPEPGLRRDAQVVLDHYSGG